MTQLHVHLVVLIGAAFLLLQAGAVPVETPEETPITTSEKTVGARICVESEWETISENSPQFSQLGLNHDPPVVGSIIYCESSALDRVATKAGYSCINSLKFIVKTLEFAVGILEDDSSEENSTETNSTYTPNIITEKWINSEVTFFIPPSTNTSADAKEEKKSP
uniref:Uncharacterized protein n=1 Tax=Timema tahoe TaxID=61484 RepID=A0A7R9IC90_9NEOP|nr:unnamed protein product [Timema tahoe]